MRKSVAFIAPRKHTRTMWSRKGKRHGQAGYKADKAAIKEPTTWTKWTDPDKAWTKPSQGALTQGTGFASAAKGQQEDTSRTRGGQQEDTGFASAARQQGTPRRQEEDTGFASEEDNRVKGAARDWGRPFS